MNKLRVRLGDGPLLRHFGNLADNVAANSVDVEGLHSPTSGAAVQGRISE